MKKRVEQSQVQELSHSLAITGQALMIIMTHGGKDALSAYVQDVEKEYQSHIVLLQGDNSIFSDQKLPRWAVDLATSSRTTQSIQSSVSATEIMVAVPLLSKERPGLTLVGSIPRIMRPPIVLGTQEEKGWSRALFFIQRFGMKFIIVMLLAGCGCYLLARSLTSSIRALRKATKQIGQGDFSARVELLSHSGDEIADLSRDFNIMAERTETLLQSQKRLLRDVSHELRSPLTRQNIALELTRQQFAEAEPYLARIEKESLRLGNLIDQLLILTRLESDVDTSPKESVNLKLLLNDLLHDADFEASGQNLSIKRHGFAEVSVLGSREMLGRALENIIRNGLRYTAAATGIEVGLKKVENTVRITVQDHGPGVPREYLESIFKPFFRVADSRDRASGGTGIGLAIAKQAIVMHGGSIVACNVPNGGLLVEVRISLR
ncbi:MAG: ATP-binding protein [Spirochaetales bacterium]|nr:ATP-binding protein [Spirochaetales bacterium]